LYKTSYFFNKYDVLYKFQFGFRKNYSTTLALLDVLDSCYSNIDVNNKILGIFLDLQKAFDTVDHKILLYKLHYYGIRGVMFTWLENYLNDRKQFTIVNSVSSNIGNITCGVPQGSVLGPLLFLIYMNDIKNAVPNNEVKLFADDTNIFIFGSNLKDLEYQAKVCLENIELWFSENKSSLNLDKTSYTLFNCNNKTESNVSLSIVQCGQLIKKVSNCKYLGVFIDESFSWTVHIDYVYKKIIKFTSFFYKLRTLVPFECLCKIYYAFVFPYINYGVEVYANCTKLALDKLIKLNNKLLRILLNKNYDTPTIELYRYFNVLPIPLLYEMKMLEIVHNFNFHKHLLPQIFQNYFFTNSSVHQHNTRNKQNLHIPFVNSSVGEKRLLVQGSKFWNALPSHFKVYSSLPVFTNSMKTYLLWR